jgi:hypothetical protein
VLEWPNVHATIVAHNETLNGALVGMEAGIGRDQSATWLEGVCQRPQHAGRKIIVKVVKNADGDSDIGRGERVVDKIVDVIANEFAATAMHSSSMLDVGFIAVEADIARRSRQAAQERARSTADVEYPIAAAGPDHIVREPLQPASRAD